MKRTAFLTMILGLVVFVSSPGFAQITKKTIRASALSPGVWADFKKGDIDELTVEFQEGDKLPVNFEAGGDLIETTESNPSYVTVQRNFWLRMKGSDVQMSLDGTVYEPYQKLISGSLSVGAGAQMAPGGTATSIDIGFKATLK